MEYINKTVKMSLLVFGLSMQIAGVLWTLAMPDNPWLWFSRFALGVVCLGFYGVINAVTSQKTK